MVVSAMEYNKRAGEKECKVLERVGDRYLKHRVVSNKAVVEKDLKELSEWITVFQA